MLESLNQYQFIFAALNLLILYFALRKILFKPVMSFMENRTKSIQDSIDDAERQKTEAGELLRKYGEQLQTAKAERDRIIGEANAEAVRVSDKLVEEARQSARAILSDARAEIETERRQMLGEVRSEVASLALAAASRVIAENMDTEKSRALVDKFLDEAGVA